MFTKAVLPDTIRALELVSQISTVKNSYLAGGTALTLHLGHRVSVDLDFFTPEEFDEKVLEGELKNLPEYKADGTGWRSVWGIVSKTKFSLFYYEYPLIKETINFNGIQIVQKEDITAMKIHAVEDRGTRRDFVDLYFLAKEFSIEEMLKFYDQKYGILEERLYNIIRSMSYFQDAEKEDEMPRMLIPVSWAEVKKFFQEQAVKLAKQRLTI